MKFTRAKNGTPLKDRILANVRHERGCWVWTKCEGGDGYGRMRVGKRTEKVSRVAYQAFVGPIPAGYDVCHHCDNRACVNPEHLYAGTRKDNMRDCVARGRQQRGERHALAKLTEANVKEIRRLGSAGEISQREIGERFGVTQGAVWLVLAGKRWKPETTVACV